MRDIFSSSPSHVALTASLADEAQVGGVCVSLAAYEDSSWISELLENFANFSEPTSRVSSAYRVPCPPIGLMLRTNVWDLFVCARLQVMRS